MLYAVISDIHANSSALRHVLADAHAQGAESIVCLGDVVGYGPLPAEALSLTRSSCALTLAGNHDDAVSGRIDASAFINLAGDAVSRHRDALSAEDLAWLKDLPYTGRIDGALLAHGDFFDPKNFYYIEKKDDAVANFEATDAELMFVGHTHVPAIFVTGKSGSVYSLAPQDFTLEAGKRYIVNPGSVGYPREANGECFSSYILYDSTERTIRFRFLPFAVASVMQRGRNPRRLKAFLPLVILLSVAILISGVMLFSDLRDHSQKQEERAVWTIDTVTIPLDPDIRHVRANVRLENDSVPVNLQLVFLSANGERLAVESATIKKSSSKAFAVPDRATIAEFQLLKVNRDDRPRVAAFLPTASIK